MATTDQPARDRDRDAACRLVEGAWADGQIVEADRDRRVDELRRAQTLAEVEMLTRDLRAPDYLQTPTAPVAPRCRRPCPPRGDADPLQPRRRGSRGRSRWSSP